MKVVYLPFIIEKIVKLLCYISVLLLDLVNFILTPIKKVKFKAHIFIASIIAIYYIYFGLILHHENTFILAILSFLLISLCIALVKYARKKLIKLRHILMEIFYSPVGVCFYMKPLFNR